MNQQHVTNAYNTTISAMRQARDNAISQRASYSVTFSNAALPHTIVVAPTVTGFQGAQNSATYQLPQDDEVSDQFPALYRAPARWVRYFDDRN